MDERTNLILDFLLSFEFKNTEFFKRGKYEKSLCPNQVINISLLKKLIVGHFEDLCIDIGE